MIEEYFTFNEEGLNDHWLMIDLPKEKTGLDRPLFAITHKCVEDMNGPRIRVHNSNAPIINTSELKSVFFWHEKVYPNETGLDENVYQIVKEFIEKNSAILQRFWYAKINGAQLIDGINKI